MTGSSTPISGAGSTAAAHISALAGSARQASYALSSAHRAAKDAALHAMADALDARAGEVVEANARDVAAARESGISDAMVDRLSLDAGRVAAMATGLRDMAGLADPIGEVVRGSTLPNGLELRQVRVPMGVIGMVYEGRPNVTADAAGICLKAGSAVLLRGSSSARESNRAIVDVLREALATTDVPADAVQLVEGGHEAVDALMSARGEVDLLIPRGGAGLIERVVTRSSVPVIETGVGNCHVYIDASADLDMAERIVLNAKTQRVSVCNSAETVLVHRDIAEQAWSRLVPALLAAGVTIHGDEQVSAVSDEVVPVNDDDFATEYLALEVAAGTVDSLDDAVSHIRRFGSGHTEAIVTGSTVAARRFTAAVDAAAVVVNASTRFTDGAEFGFGAEIGISTQKLHARGPMGLTEMTSTTYVVTGDGQVRE